MANVEFVKVNKEYDNGFCAIRDLDLVVNDGEFLILVGPSGCGKSTALRMVAGLEDVTGGDLRIGGTSVIDFSPKKRNIAMVFQNYALYPHMSVYENIGFSMKLAKVSRAETDRRVREVARTLELESLLEMKPAQLSGGQRQRVAMGRAMVREPAAFLMDEPLSNLDAKLRVQMRAEIARLQRSLGVTTLYVTHDQIEAMTMGERVAVLKSGILQQIDSPKNLYHKPTNAFVAGFIGSPSMNLFESRIIDGAVQIGSNRIVLSRDYFNANPKLSDYNNQSIVVGFRPEHLSDTGLSIGIDTTQSTETALTATVSAIEELGAEHVAHINIDAPRVDSGDPDTVNEIAGQANAVARLAPQSTAKAGDTIKLSIDVDNLHFFDYKTHHAIC